MCTRDTIHHLGCGCKRQNSPLTFCAPAKQYPHRPCQRIVEKRIECAERGDRICAKCASELRRSVVRLFTLTGMGVYGRVAAGE
jgi:hypothetical protein